MSDIENKLYHILNKKIPELKLSKENIIKIYNTFLEKKINNPIQKTIQIIINKNKEKRSEDKILNNLYSNFNKNNTQQTNKNNIQPTNKNNIQQTNNFDSNITMKIESLKKTEPIKYNDSILSKEELKTKVDNIVKLPPPPNLNNEIKPISNINIDSSEEVYTPKIIIIDSKDRNIDLYPLASEYSFNLYNNNDNKGILNNNIKYIKSIELLECILLDNIDGDLPYILLEFDEIYGNLCGTNKHINNSFAKLSSYKTINNYRYYNFDFDIPKYIFDVRKNIDKLTIKLKDPEGNLIKFKSTGQNSIKLKIMHQKINLNKTVLKQII